MIIKKEIRSAAPVKTGAFFCWRVSRLGAVRCISGERVPNGEKGGRFMAEHTEEALAARLVETYSDRLLRLAYSI